MRRLANIYFMHKIKRTIAFKNKAGYSDGKTASQRHKRAGDQNIAWHAGRKETIERNEDMERNENMQRNGDMEKNGDTQGNEDMQRNEDIQRNKTEESQTIERAMEKHAMEGTMANGHLLTGKEIAAFRQMLETEERAENTVQKYLREVRAFVLWLDGKAVTKERTAAWKEHLVSSGYAPSTVNAKLSPLNDLFDFLGWGECRVKFLKIQRKIFRDQSRVLTKEEYLRLLKAAGQTGQKRLELLIETICATGIRVSEVQYITVEAARNRRAEVRLKGKVRTILLPGKLCRKLLKYAGKQKNASGEIFVTKSGKSLSRRQIWREMKRLCRDAGVEESKVFPHNLRHLFATAFYHACKDIVKLSDILGHSSIETTRIYLLTAGEEHARQLERLGLVL